jgi:transposase InsO family protein
MFVDLYLSTRWAGLVSSSHLRTTIRVGSMCFALRGSRRCLSASRSGRSKQNVNMVGALLRSDHGAEYLSSRFNMHLDQCGIRHQLTVPHTPEQNGVAERLNRTLLDSVRSMLKHLDVDKRWWAEAVSTACYMKNRVTTSGLPDKTTPHEIWNGARPNVSHLRVFGSK